MGTCRQAAAAVLLPQVLRRQTSAFLNTLWKKSVHILLQVKKRMHQMNALPEPTPLVPDLLTLTLGEYCQYSVCHPVSYTHLDVYKRQH